MKKTATQLAEIDGWLAGTDIGFFELRTPHETVTRGQEAFDASGETVAPNVTVNARSVGVFIHAHPTRGHACVAIGDAVDAGQVIGLLRIGVLLLPVVATHRGTVAGLLVANGARVGFGTPLVAIDPFE